MDPTSRRGSDVALGIIASGVLVAALVYGRSFLLPLALAIFFWNLMEAMIQGFASIRIARWSPPRWLATLLGIATVGIGFYVIIMILLGQIDAIIAAMPRYISRFEAIVANLTEWLGFERSAKIRSAIAGIDLAKWLPGLIASTQSIVVSALLVIAYVAFLFVEQDHVGAKIAAMFQDEAKAGEANKLLAKISTSVRRYIWLKTIVSLLTSIGCYAVLRFQQIDFAETWALLIFALNYIPNIGSIIGVALPCLLAIVQFETLTPFFVLLTGLTLIQIAMGSVLEPLLMGKSLNMSPFAIVLSLAFWGIIWGIVGMFLSVPILVIIMIICANVPGWRWIAISLSRDGEIAANI